MVLSFEKDNFALKWSLKFALKKPNLHVYYE